MKKKIAVICLVGLFVTVVLGNVIALTVRGKRNAEEIVAESIQPPEVPIGVSLPEVTKEPEETEVPKSTKESEMIREPEATQAPETPKEVEVTKAPETPKEPEVTQAPETPKEPEVTKVPETPKEPEVTKVPETPKEPEATKVPETPKEPEVTQAPETTKVPEPTGLPEEENEPQVTSEPAAETTPIPTEPPHIHSYITKSEPASCETGGRIYEECSGCGDICNEIPINARGHDYKMVYVLNNGPTCTSSAYYNLICTVCGHNGGDGRQPGFGHTPVEVSRTEANCCYTGVIRYECATCKMDLGGEAYLDPDNHSYKEYIKQYWSEEQLTMITEMVTLCEWCQKPKE